MLLSLLTPITRTVSTSSRRFFLARRLNPQMSSESLSLIQKRKHANFRVINVSGFKTDLMEIPSQDPALHVLFIPGNPGVVSFYTDFLELLYESLGGTASVTGNHDFAHDRDCFLLVLDEAIGHISHTEKISFIEQELQDVEVPIVLVGHSIGSYISLEIFKRLQEKYHTIRNVLFMAMTEFQQLPEKPDWDFIRGKKNQIALLFGLDDHWGPLHVYEEIRKQAPDARLEVEREGHTHAFSCTEAGSVWVAQHVSSSIKSNIQTTKSYQSRM
ncbi:UNVERIFIED_CONTAM: Lipid droplet-associated hydrolase [Sesamum radiatum]|uniref:Lipid droplet-associated hydrolase n=1 Tax=Sesamum radiatum TaxID=300843 RepID=A0AAW2NQE9_SESRA